MQVTNLFYQHPHALIIILFDIIIVIIRSSSDVCKLRLDFETMVLAAPFSVRIMIMIKKILDDNDDGHSYRDKTEDVFFLNTKNICLS